MSGTEAATGTAPNEGDPPPEAIDVVEIATAVMVRNFELLRRRSDIYSDLDRSEYLLLRMLERAGSADIRSLACALGLDPSTVGRQVAALERKKLVTRRPDPTDRRCSLISSTAEGQRRMESTRQRRRQSIVEALGDWDERELREFGDYVRRYNAAIARQYLLDQPPHRQQLGPFDAEELARRD